MWMQVKTSKLSYNQSQEICVTVKLRNVDQFQLIGFSQKIYKKRKEVTYE